MSVRIDVYEAQACQQCRDTKRWLERRRIVHRSHVLTDAVRSMAREAGYSQAPVVVVTTDLGLVLDCWGGFNPERLLKWAVQGETEEAES